MAITAISILKNNNFKISDKDISRGLINVKWAGRLQIIGSSPKIIIDAAHNPDGVDKSIKTIQDIFSYRKVFVIVGICKNKNYKRMMKTICTIADQIIAVKPATHRALKPDILMKEALLYGKQVIKFENIQNGVEYALTHTDSEDLILGIGSHYTIGEILNYYKKA